MAKDKEYTKKDAARDTNSSTREVSRAQHAARDDCQNSNHPTDKYLSKGMRDKRTPDKDRK